MSLSEKIDLYMDFAAGVFLFEAPYTPPSLTPCNCVQYTYSHREGGELTREKARGAKVHKAGRKYQQD